MAMTSIQPAARRVARLAIPAAALIALSLAQAQTQAPDAAFKPTVLHKFSGLDKGGAKPMVPPALAADGRLYGHTFLGVKVVAPAFWGQGGVYGLDAATGGNSSFEVLTGVSSGSTPLLPTKDGGFLIGGRGIDLVNVFSNVPTLVSIRDGKPVSVPAPKVDILGSMALDAAGNVYMGSGDPLSCGTSTTNNRGNTLWRMNADQSQSLVLDFCHYSQAQGSAQLHPKGGAPVASVWSEADQALYVLTGVSATGVADSSMAADNQGRSVGTLIKLDKSAIEEGIASNGKPAADKVEVLHTFMRARDGEPTSKGQRIVGMIEAGEWLYGTTQFNAPTAGSSTDTRYGGTLWRVKKSDPSSFSVVHYFRGSDTIASDGTAQADGSAPSGPLVLAADGNIYGTTASDGSTMSTPKTGLATPYGAGVLYRIKVGTAADRADDSYEVLHRFDMGSEGGKLVGLSAGAVSGGVQKLYGAANAGGDGNPVAANGATTGNGTVFSIDVPLPTAAFSEALTASASTATVGATIQLNWATTQAGSCSASGDWSGAQQATASQVPVVIAREGANTYTLSCTSANDGLPVTSSVTVQGTAAAVVTPPVVTPPAVDNGNGGGGPLSAWLLAPLAALAWTRRRATQR